MTEYTSHFAARRAAQWKAGAETSIRRLEEMLATATPIEAEAIEARIDQIRRHRRANTSRRRSELNRRRAARMAARTPDELARDQAEAFPDGRATCKRCGRTVPVAAMAPDPTKRRGVKPFCRSCWGSGAAGGDHG